MDNFRSGWNQRRAREGQGIRGARADSASGTDCSIERYGRRSLPNNRDDTCCDVLARIRYSRISGDRLICGGKCLRTFLVSRRTDHLPDEVEAWRRSAFYSAAELQARSDSPLATDE